MGCGEDILEKVPNRYSIKSLRKSACVWYRAKIQMKLPRNLLNTFQIAPASVRINITPHHGGLPYVTHTSDPAYKSASKAYETTFGVPALPVRSGGSIPIVALFEQVLGAKSILMGFGLDSDAIRVQQHMVFNYFKGIETIPYFYKYYGSTKESTLIPRVHSKNKVAIKIVSCSD